MDVLEDVAVLAELGDRVPDRLVEDQVRVGLSGGAGGAVLAVVADLADDLDRRERPGEGLDLADQRVDQALVLLVEPRVEVLELPLVDPLVRDEVAPHRRWAAS